MFKNYFSLTKPGIIFGNAITVIGGFCLASHGHPNPWLLGIVLLGISLIIASGCVFNNYIDRDIDKIMERTRNRVLVQGAISSRHALIYATTLGIIGILILLVMTNLLTVMIALLGFFVYVVVYSLWLKRSSVFGTFIGSISGAVPPVVGYCAVSYHFDLGALLLFLILSVWQLPHSFAIGIYRYNDYKAAGIPLLPIKKGFQFTKMAMMVCVALYISLALMLTIFGYTGTWYLLITGLIGILWFILCVSGLNTANDKLWARRMFLFSIVNIMVISLMMSIDVVTAYPRSMLMASLSHKSQSSRITGMFPSYDL